MSAVDGTSNVGGVPGSPLRGTNAASPIRDRQARREDEPRFEALLAGAAEEPEEEPASERRTPHPPPDEDSGNQLDVTA